MNEQTLNRSVTDIDTEPVIKKFPSDESRRPCGFTAESYQTFKDELVLILKLLQTTEREELF